MILGMLCSSSNTHFILYSTTGMQSACYNTSIGSKRRVAHPAAAASAVAFASIWTCTASPTGSTRPGDKHNSHHEDRQAHKVKTSMLLPPSMCSSTQPQLGSGLLCQQSGALPLLASQVIASPIET